MTQATFSAQSPQALFTSYPLGSLALPNRVVMAPMTRNRAGDARTPNASMATYYAQRASAGLLITEATQVSQQGQGYVATPGIHNLAQVEGWKQVTDAVHQAGGRIFLQLWHVGRVSHTSFQPDGGAPVAPSAIKINGTTITANGAAPFSTPRALALSEIPDVIAQYAHGAQNAKVAGFDGVEIHGANGYLIDQFLRDGSNKRTDAYGGSVENRARFLFDVTEAVIKVWGPDKVGVRLSPYGTFNDMHDSNPKATFGYAAKVLGQLHLAYLHVVEGIAGGSFGSSEPRITRYLKEQFGGTVIANGGFDAESAEASIKNGEADLVSFGVPFLANPDLPWRLKTRSVLNAPDRDTFYVGGDKGYIDYPALSA